MPFFIAGRRRRRAAGNAAAQAEPDTPVSAPITTVRVAAASVPEPRSLGRRDAEFAFDRVLIPSLIIDHTELVLQQAGVQGHEGFAVWAGTLACGDAHVATLIVPRAATGPAHGEITPETTAHMLTALDERDLVPADQLHSHPRRAFLCGTDAIRPLVAVPGSPS
jgi:hypothetical protein